MADFRKLLLALIVGALLFTTVASAQPYACRATADPTLVRSEGIAEYMGDILLNCSGAVPSTGILVNIRLRLTANITSNPFSATPTYNEATLILDGGANGYRGYSSLSPVTPYYDGTQNVFQAVRISDDEIEWQGVTLAAAGSTGQFSSIRLTDVRGNVQSRGDFATIYASINITGSTTVPVDNNLLVVADTRPGLIFSVGPANYKNCVDPATVGAYVLNFKEGFGSAFKAKGTASAQTTSGGGYKTESGFQPPTLTAGFLMSQAVIGQANNSTILFARLKAVPTGVKIYAPTVITTPYGMVVHFMKDVKADGTGGTEQTTAGTIEVTNGRLGYMVYSNNNDSISFQETVVVPLTITYATPGGPLGTATANGTLAPLSTVYLMDLDAPEPRFVDKGTTDSTAFAIAPCRTIILFPYITNQALFDTGIAIANTSKDPIYEDITATTDPLYALKTAPQAGACKLHYFGNTSNGPGPADQVSPVIPAGGHLVFQLSGGGGVFAQNGGFTACASGQCVAPLYQGYLFAVCDFQWAHGYAFISDYGSQKLAQGYLALIIPDLPFASGVGRWNGDSGYIPGGPLNNVGESLAN